MFIDDLKVVEPSTYPTYEGRVQFEEVLNKQTDDAEAEITSISTERAELRLTDFIYTIGQLMQKSDSEVASIILGRRGPINADLI